MPTNQTDSKEKEIKIYNWNNMEAFPPHEKFVKYKYYLEALSQANEEIERLKNSYEAKINIALIRENRHYKDENKILKQKLAEAQKQLKEEKQVSSDYHEEVHRLNHELEQAEIKAKEEVFKDLDIKMDYNLKKEESACVYFTQILELKKKHLEVKG